MRPMFLILGLGNPGPQYVLTRHNAGFRVIDHVSSLAKIPLYKTGCHAFWGAGLFAGRQVVLAKPMTYMNNSGMAAAALVRHFGVEPAQLLAIYDDMDLPLGTIRLRPGGGSGGHKGMDSLIFHLQTDRFPRLRIGIGRPQNSDAVDYVLEAFSAEEEAVLGPVLQAAASAVEVFLAEGIEAAMNRFNQKI